MALLMTTSLQGLMTLRWYVICHFPLGLLFIFLSDIYINLVKDYTHEPDITSLAYEFNDFLFPYGCISFLLIAFLFTFSRLIFDEKVEKNTLKRMKNGSAADQAFLDGLSLMLIGGIVYLAFYVIVDSPARMIFL